MVIFDRRKLCDLFDFWVRVRVRVRVLGNHFSFFFPFPPFRAASQIRSQSLSRHVPNITGRPTTYLNDFLKRPGGRWGGVLFLM